MKTLSCFIARLAMPLAALGAIVATSGCAEDREAVDRVQPFALEKSFFVGEDFTSTADDPEFWTQATLIDVGYGASQDGLFTSTYAQPMSRMKWQITEDLLIGRLAYERIAGSDGKGTGGPTQDGVVVVAYEIDSHFDVVRAYNSTTGEELNIVEENSTDRPWYEREYFRVDWSKSLNVDSYDFDTLSLLGIYGSISYEALSYYVDDPADKDAPHFDLEAGYFDITNKAFAKPGTIDLRHLGWGIDSFPSCFLENDFLGGSAPAGSCSPVELTVRHSFRKIEDSDYEPVHWDGFRFQSYGGFYVERQGYARNYGMSDDLWYRFLARYPIWERSHYYADPAAMTGAVECYTPSTTPFGADANRDSDGDGVIDECAAVGKGSRCNTFRQRCTLPYSQRTAKPIAWYYTSGSHPQFFEPSADATHDWDVAMRAAVRTAQYTDCKAQGATDCDTRFPVYFGQQDENVDAIQLAREVDACRAGTAYADKAGNCDAVADEVGAKRGLSAGVISIAKMAEMVVLCHSPVEAGDPAACGTSRLPTGVTAEDCATAIEANDADTKATCAEALNVRMGDLRYHQINVITNPQTPSPWGIYTDAEDPLTGETVSASINVWAHVNDLWSQKVVDNLRYIAGELTTGEVTEGLHVRDWATAAQAASLGGALPKLTDSQIKRRVKDFTSEGLDRAGYDPADHTHEAAPGEEQTEALELPKLSDALRKQVRALKQDLSQVRASMDATSAMRPIYAARRQAARGSQMEAQLMTPMLQQMFGVAGMPLTDGLLDIASPLRGGNPSLQRDIYNMKQNALANRGACMLHEAPAPLGIDGLGDVLQAKFGAFNPSDDEPTQQLRAERMRDFLARRAHYAVIVHEMGHSIGMRHNFVSSSDAWGYRPQYWQLRTRDGQVRNPCNNLQSDGTNCVGPRYFDPVTKEERDNLIWMWMHSSVMDYAGEATQDMLGLGVYDFAAAKMFYGDVVAVHADPSYANGTVRGDGMLEKMDNFGGILGIQPSFNGDDIHYSQLNTSYELIKDCATVDPQRFKPAAWNEKTDGVWHPVLDGLIVSVNGQPTKCKQQSVGYARWEDLDPGRAGFGGPSVDPTGRIRLPYGFATDGWADLGNLSVYRHDNGADPYELFDFLIAQQEVNHIFDNYRRGKQGFSVRSAANRILRRYNEKMRDAAKGLGLLRNIYADFALSLGYDFESFWTAVAADFFPEVILASGMAFDHFARQAARPQAGNHFYDNSFTSLMSADDTIGQPGATQVIIPNGATGYFGDIGIGGKPVENRLADDQGEYDSEFTVNAGSYYDKLYTAMLFTESVDNFISSSRTDFTDARYRAVSLADLFPDGYRRWLGNNLTGDIELKGAHVRTDAVGTVLTDAQGFPSEPLGWTTWWGETPEVCFPANGTTLCERYGDPNQGQFGQTGVAQPSAPLDPQMGWEQQKFLIAWTLMYLPENAQQRWIDLMRIWELGKDSDPGFANRIEFHNPSGKVYVAKTYGSETIFGKRVQRGIAARVLEYANSLLGRGYQTSDGPDLDGDGKADWYIPVIDPTDGRPIVKYDPSVQAIDAGGFLMPNGRPGCEPTDSSACTCSANRACIELQAYVEVPFFLRQALDAYGLASPEMKGVY